MPPSNNPFLLSVDGQIHTIEECLSVVTNPEYIVIYNFQETIDLKPLAKLQSPIVLIIKDCKFAHIDLRPIVKLPIKVLGITNCEIENETVDLSPFNTTRDQSVLRHLSLTNCSLRHIDLEPISSCKQLQVLSIDHNQRLSNIDLTPLRKCTRLQKIRLSHNASFRSIEIKPLGLCENIREIDVRETGLTILDITPLMHFFSSSDENQGITIQADDSCRIVYDRSFQGLCHVPDNFEAIDSEEEITRQHISKEHQVTRENFTSLKQFVVSPRFVLGMSASFFSQIMIQYIFQEYQYTLLTAILGGFFFATGAILIAKD